MIFTHGTLVNIFFEDPAMMALISMSLFDKIKIQVLGLFILTSASVTFKNFEKQKRSILDDVF